LAKGLSSRADGRFGGTTVIIQSGGRKHNDRPEICLPDGEATVARRPAMRILVVEDQLPMLRALRQGLEEEGFAVDTATDGEAADVKARTTPYDVIVLDVMLPKVDGLTLLKQWRRAGLTTHVLMLTAKTATGDKVTGLDSGADDYLTKPFDMSELLARVRALIRRGHTKKDPILRVHDLVLNTAARSVTRAGKPIDLTPREYALLEFLAFHAGHVVPHDTIWEHLYDEFDDPNPNLIAVYIRYLRKKIDVGFDPPLILSKWGVGYLLRGDGPTDAQPVADD
jgi:DNA-binding response OmpR family regulator